MNPRVAHFRHVSVSIELRSTRVYEFVRSVANMPRWASGLASGVTEENGRWYADSPMGRVEIEMVRRNGFGVLDHDVVTSDGVRTHNAFRVTPAGSGSVLTFTLLRAPTSSDEDFEKDAATIAHDLRALKRLLESR